ncbi:MAG TPA: urea ABC transporter permease subunit UrtB [Porticoccaceae bacterium]|jgi:urea transport system permease protein|nr:urea ABC transporter permease subunit UrtB [Gammaproteobacteria bacterium]HIL60333.1 urea ABC transporter permease subunit UrtB [Porticoccaceae bacterium]
MLRKILILAATFQLFGLPPEVEAQTQDASQANSALEEIIPILATARRNEVPDLVEIIANSQDSRRRPFLESLLNGQIYFTRDEERVVKVLRVDDQFQINDALSNEELGLVGTRAVRRVSVNNSLRRTIRLLIAGIDLQDDDPQVRLSAVEYMVAQEAAESREQLLQLQSEESDESVIQAIEEGLALTDLSSKDASLRSSALDKLAGNLNSTIRNSIRDMAENDPDPEIQAKAQDVLYSIQSKVELYGYVQTLFFGLSLGSVLLLAAIGLAITFGVMGVINMAHGELIMLGAYTTYVVQQAFPDSIGMSLFIAIPAAFLVSGLFGILIERGIIRFLYGRPLETLLATFGISLILQQLVRSVFSPQNRQVSNPEWMSGQWQINEVLALTYNRLYILIFCFIVFALLSLLLKKTRLGIEVRAVSQNRAMAKAIGVRSGWVDALTFGLGSGIAGIAGVALSQITNVGPNLGQAYIVDSFMVVVFGGVGNLWGTFYGAFILGIGNKILEPWAGAVVAKILILVFIILFIQKQPRGLFPQKGRGMEE